MHSVRALTALFDSIRVLVVGDAMLDEYLSGNCSRISPEAPVPVVRVESARTVLGGAANTAANVVALGGHAVLVSPAGDDEAGQEIRRHAAALGVDCHFVSDGRATLRKTRIVSQHQQIARLDREDTRPLSPEASGRLLQHIAETLPVCQIVVISDYAKGAINEEIGRRIVEMAREAGRKVVVDPRPQNAQCYEGCDYLTPNWKESLAMLGWPAQDPDADAVARVTEGLRERTGAHVLLTLGASGMVFESRDGAERFSVPAIARDVFDVSGAGDTVAAAFTLCIASGANHRSAVELANAAAGIVVGKFGTATVSKDELLRDDPGARLVSRDALGALASELRARGRRIVTLNGSFDVLHAGHLYIINEARKHGHVLIVGLNSDASVRSNKGVGRPIVGEQERAEMVLALRAVDYVHIFDEADPREFIRAVRPDVHVNGAEYGEHCIEADVVREGGGRLELVDRLPALSTTALMDRLKETQSPS